MNKRLLIERNKSSKLREEINNMAYTKCVEYKLHLDPSKYIKDIITIYMSVYFQYRNDLIINGDTDGVYLVVVDNELECYTATELNNHIENTIYYKYLPYYNIVVPLSSELYDKLGDHNKYVNMDRILEFKLTHLQKQDNTMEIIQPKTETMISREFIDLGLMSRTFASEIVLEDDIIETLGGVAVKGNAIEYLDTDGYINILPLHRVVCVRSKNRVRLLNQ